MKKFWIQVGILTILIIGSLYLFTNVSMLEPFLPFKSTNSGTQIKINQIILDVEVADTPQGRNKGLGGRENLATSSGMMFVFPEEKKYQFWMKGMEFPLDFIFIRDGKVVDLLNNVKPPEQNQKDETLPIYQPVVPINMMLEVNSGFVQANNIKVGDAVYLVAP